MKEMLWRAVARICNIPTVRDRLITYAKKRPYTHIGKGDDVYMERYWVFNPYQLSSGKKGWRQHLPSVRLHWIRRPDQDRHLHDHPWNARTIILKGWYVERRQREDECGPSGRPRIVGRFLQTGDTAAIKYGEYHAIDKVSPGGVWTLFITWKYQGTWGFNVDGKKVPWKTYLGLDK